MGENKSEVTQTTNSFANQSNQKTQPQPAPTVAQPSVPLVQTAQPSFQQQTASPATANVVTTQTNVANQTTDEKKSKLKYVAYFLLGLILSVLGLFIGIIWIMAKEKQTKMRKVIALLLGVTLSVVVWFVVAGGITFEGTTTSTVDTSQPRSVEEREMVTDLSNLYPNLSFKVLYGEHNPPLTLGNTTISTFVTVEISSEVSVTLEQIAEVGKQVCSTLTRLQLSVSQVQVETVSTKAVFSSSQGIGGTCEEYNSGVILNTLQSM